MKKVLKSRKAQSIIIGYVLLIVLAISVSIIVYNQMRSFVPKDVDECPDGISLMAKRYSYLCGSNQITLILRNNGLFDIDGFLLRGSENPDAEIAITELGQGDFKDKILIEEEEKIDITLSKDISFIEVIPYIEKDGKRLICSNARIKQNIKCSNCIDSDGGLDIYIMGIVIKEDLTFGDVCKADGTLLEFYCEEDEVKSITTDCPEGYECKLRSGACTKI